jgi:translation initiation factor IF-2
MAVTTVAQFALELNRPASTLLEQLKSAGVVKASDREPLTEDDKEKLLAFLRSSHGTSSADRKKITLVRKSTSEIKQADLAGKARTIEVEVRNKRIFVKRADEASDGSAANVSTAEALEHERSDTEAERTLPAERPAAEQARREQQELKRRQKKT